jgi:hypothetical protein
MSYRFDGNAPSSWMRGLGIVCAALIAGYGGVGVLRNDLHVSVGKSDHVGVHLHGALAWLCFAGMLMMSIAIFRVVAPESGDGKYDFYARRNRYGPMFVLGLVLFIAAQGIASVRA